MQNQGGRKVMTFLVLVQHSAGELNNALVLKGSWFILACHAGGSSDNIAGSIANGLELRKQK